MEEGETVPILSRKELRKQKLMEYLAAKGKLKQPNLKPYLRDDCQVKKPVTSVPKGVTGKENMASADKVSYENRKIPTLVAQSTTHPVRRVFGISKTVNIKGSNSSSATCGPAQPKQLQQLQQNPVLTRMNIDGLSKSNLSAASHLKKQPSTQGTQSSGRASSNAARTAVTKSNSRFSSSSNAAWSRPISVRMSLGPIVKTKTGLIPAVTQPRNSQNQNLTHTSATTADTATTSSVTNKVRPRTLSSVSSSKRSATAQSKPLPTTTLNKPVDERTTISSTARSGIKVQSQNKPNSKPLLGKSSHPSCKSQQSSGLKSTSSSSKCTNTYYMSRPSTSARQLTNKSTKLSSEGAGDKNGQQCKVTSGQSLGPANRYSSRVADGAMEAAVADLGGKTKTCKVTDGKKVHSSADAPPPQTDIKRTSAPGMSHTVPRTARTISHTGHATDMKTTKVPVRTIPKTEEKKLTAVQQERMRKLQEWREAKGISYKRPPMPVKPLVRRTVSVPQPFWATMKEEDEAHSLICAVDRSLADCIKLIEEGCPSDQVKKVLSRLPAVSQKFAKYWICQARLMEQEGNLDVLPMFEEAVGVVLEPVDELRTVVFEILKKKDEIQASGEHEKEEDQNVSDESSPESINNPMMTPKPVRALIYGEKGNSSVVKYKITATPGGPQSQQKEPARVNGQEVRFFTPVRRSVRIERASLRYPVSLQDHDLCVASYNDLMSKEGEEEKDGETSPSANNTMYVYRQNEALNDKVFVQLVCEDGV